MALGCTLTRSTLGFERLLKVSGSVNYTTINRSRELFSPAVCILNTRNSELVVASANSSQQREAFPLLQCVYAVIHEIHLVVVPPTKSSPRGL